MKARIKKTGKIVNIYAECLAGFLADDGSYYEDDELSTELDDWSFFRREAAKDILCSMIEARKPITFQPVLIGDALRYTNALIEQLKQE